MTSHIQLHHTNISRPTSRYTGTLLPFYVEWTNIGNDTITRYACLHIAASHFGLIFYCSVLSTHIELP